MTMPVALSSLAEALLHALWQGAAICAVAWALDRMVLRRSAASTRFVALHAGVWLVVVTFGWTWTGLWQTARGAAISSGPIAAASHVADGPVVLPWLVLGAWAAGATWHAARVTIGLVGLARWRRMALPLGPAWHEAVAALQRALGTDRTVALGARDGLDAPIVFGLFRPIVLVPMAWAAGVPTAAMRAALAHELGHVLRHDWPIQLALHGVGTLFHFHPGVRWMIAELGRLRELACDELAVAHAVDRLEFARALAELEHARITGTPALAANGAPLVQRIEHLVQHDLPRPRAAANRAPMATALIAAAIACAPVVLAFACQVDGATHPVTATTEVQDDEAATDVVATTASSSVAIAVPWLREPLAAHAAAIDAAARRHGVDPSLLAIVTWVESRGDADARSTMGARGLMQLMPATAAGIAARRGVAGHRVERLDDPRYNLDLGAYHLAQLLETYGGGDELDADVIGLAAAAYNGGPQRVEAWLGGAPLPDETARYCEVVVAMWQARHDPRAPQMD